MSIIFLTTTLYPMIAKAAAISIDGIEQSCSYQKAYGLAVKVLLVYGSHALTVKTKPGSGLLDSARDVLTALLCPGYASTRAFIDLCMGFNASGIKGCVNTESACLRINETDFNKKRMIRTEGEINARPRGAGETFVIIPRGKHHYFRSTDSPLFNHRSPMKASIATVQLVFGIYQLAAASQASINKYGYGSYVFTIIPYAYASLINGLMSVFTAQYSEVQELLLDETKGATIGDIFNGDAYADGDQLSGIHVLITVVIYLTIIGASTHFHKRASTTAQRGWFVSWVIMGSFFGINAYLGSRSDDDQNKLYLWIFPIMIGVPTIGGFVSLSQQYLANFVCSSTS